MVQTHLSDEEKGDMGEDIRCSGRNTVSALIKEPQSPISSQPDSSVRTLVTSISCLKEAVAGRLQRTSVPDSAEAPIASIKDRVTKVREVHNQPVGYPRLATFLDSQDIFSVFRRFGYLSSRLLLEKQDDLRRLEAELDRLDKISGKNSPSSLRSRKRGEDEDPAPQQALLDHIEGKYLEYCELLCSAKNLADFNKPTDREHRAVWNWIENAQPLFSAEQSFIKCKEDLITLRSGREYAWLDSMIEWLIYHLRCRLLTWIFRSKETERKSDGRHKELYYTRSRIELAANSLLCLAILTLLIIPIYFLFSLTSKANSVNSLEIPLGQESDTETKVSNPPPGDRLNTICIGILLISTLAFSAVISLFTSARRHEILGASAAYCAVLVVFIGNLGDGIGILH